MVLSENDKRILETFLTKVKSQSQNPSGRPRSEEHIDQAPETYIALIPAGGLPANGVVPGSALCDIYQIIDPTEGPEACGFSLPIFNMHSSAIPEGEYIIVGRDKFGAWQALGSAGGGSDGSITDASAGVATGPDYIFLGSGIATVGASGHTVVFDVPAPTIPDGSIDGTTGTATGPDYTFTVGTSGSDFNIAASVSTVTFNLPDADGSGLGKRGVVNTGTQSFLGHKTVKGTITSETSTAGSTFFEMVASGATQQIGTMDLRSSFSADLPRQSIEWTITDGVAPGTSDIDGRAVLTIPGNGGSGIDNVGTVFGLVGDGPGGQAPAFAIIHYDGVSTTHVGVTGTTATGDSVMGGIVISLGSSIVSAAAGGTGVNSSGSTGVPRVTAGVWTFDTLSTANGWSNTQTFTAPNDSTEAVIVQGFSNTDTSVIARIRKYSGAANDIAQFSTFGVVLRGDDGSGVITTFDTGTSGSTSFTRSDAVTTASSTIFLSKHGSTGTPGNRFGQNWIFQNQDPGNTYRSCGYLLSEWNTNSTAAGTRRAWLDFGLIQLTAGLSFLRGGHPSSGTPGIYFLDGSGTTAPVARQTGDVATMMTAYGLATSPVYLTSGLSGQVSLANGGTNANLSDPGAHRLWGWDDTDNAIVFMTIGTGLSYDHATHTLSVSAGITIGTTTITGGTSGRILYNNGGVVGEMTTTGSGTVVALATAPVFPTTITVGAAGGTTGSILFKGSTSGTVTVKSANAAGTWTLTWPTTAGTSGYGLSTNGSGTTTWTLFVTGATDGTLTLTGSTLGINLAQNNDWSGIQKLPGVTDGSDADAGDLGEFVSDYLDGPSRISVVVSTDTDVVSITLEAGDWDVEAIASFYLTKLTVFGAACYFSDVSATSPGSDGSEAYTAFEPSAGANYITSATLTRKRYSLVGTTTIYLVVNANYAGTKCEVFGGITARRIR